MALSKDQFSRMVAKGGVDLTKLSRFERKKISEIGAGLQKGRVDLKDGMKALGGLDTFRKSEHKNATRESLREIEKGLGYRGIKNKE